MKLSVRNLFLIVLFSGIFFLSLRPILDPDFWWHLRTGQLIAQTHQIPQVDPFSFTATGKPWIAHEWLSELLIYKTFTLGGPGLLIALFSAVITASFFLTFLRCPVESRPYVAGFAVLLGAIASAPLWGVRPQMFTLLLTSIFLYLLDQFQHSHKLRTLLPIPIIMLLWVNLHAGFILGIGVEVVYVLGYILELTIKRYWNKEVIDSAAQKNLWIQFAVLGASVLATLLNPNGIRILIYPFETLFDPAMQVYIQEWFSPDFHLVIWQPFALMILALIGGGMLARKPISITRILLTLFFAYASLQSMRHIPLFAIAVVPVLAEQFGSLIKIKPQLQERDRLVRWVAPVLVVLIVLAITVTLTQLIDKQKSSEAETFPKNAADWILENKPQGNMFNSYTWGGYLIWRLYPDYPVYIDGRPDMYGKEFVTDYADIYYAESGWEEALDEKDIRFVVVEFDSQLASALRQAPSWANLYEDKISVIFSKK